LDDEFAAGFPAEPAPEETCETGEPPSPEGTGIAPEPLLGRTTRTLGETASVIFADISGDMGAAEDGNPNRDSWDILRPLALTPSTEPSTEVFSGETDSRRVLNSTRQSGQMDFSPR
jgi:hypothetical protein